MIISKNSYSYSYFHCQSSRLVKISKTKITVYNFYSFFDDSNLFIIQRVFEPLGKRKKIWLRRLRIGNPLQLYKCSWFKLELRCVISSKSREQSLCLFRNSGYSAKKQTLVDNSLLFSLGVLPMHLYLHYLVHIPLFSFHVR